MDFGLTADQADFLDRFRRYLDGWDAEGIVPREMLHGIDHDDELIDLRKELVRRLGSDGWLATKWPTEYGGQGRSHVESWLMIEELAYRGLPWALHGVLIQGPVLVAVGTEDQKQRFLPLIMSGEIEFALGYSEPNAGSDVASLQTRAVREGNEYVINGDKIWTSHAHSASHVWLAARTGDTDSRHRGLAVFIVDLTSPGITVQAVHTQADFRTNQVFFDNVRVPAANRIAEENEGWKVMMLALDIERASPYGPIVRHYEELVRWALEHERDGRPVAEDEVARQQLAELAVDMEVARLLTMRSTWLLGGDAVHRAEASVNKVWNSDLRLRMGSVGLDLMGEDGQLRVGSDGAPNQGLTELFYRHAPAFRFAAGANEVQKNIIAQRGLGLPRR